MSYWNLFSQLPPWFGFVLAPLVAWGIWAQIRRRGPWRCPSCHGKRLDWEDSGTELVGGRRIDYRTYRCVACSEMLVEQAHGRLQRLADWVPGREPARPPRARAVRRDRA